MQTLDWPTEEAVPDANIHRFSHTGSNLCLDFHGDPNAALRVFSDGNHHMALQETLAAFARECRLDDIFYLTLPPPAILPLLNAPRMQIGNLRLRLSAHVFISPPGILDRAVAAGYARPHRPFMQSQGNVLLVRRGNPHAIRDIASLIDSDLRLFLPHPTNEAAAYRVYTETLQAFAADAGARWDFTDTKTKLPKVINGKRIHHREAPLALAEDRADVALVYHHLGLRYQRIFPEWFDTIALPLTPANRISDFHASLCTDAGQWGAQLMEFLQSEKVSAIYRHHGLRRP